MPPFALRARYVLPVAGQPVDGGVVTIDGSRIVAVDSKSAAGKPRDLGDVALLPGLVNAHTHLEFSDLPAPLGTIGSGLAEWIRLVIARRGRRDHDPRGAIAAGLAESRRCGTTLLGEIATGEAADYPPGSECPERQLFFESLGFSAARAESAATALEERLSRATATCGISPHAPYTVHPRLVARLAEVAARDRRPVAFHLAESRAELQLLAEGSGPFRELLEERSMWDPAAIPAGSQPLDYLDLLAPAPRLLVIHGNYLEPKAHAWLAAHRDTATLVYCPRTHARFDNEPYPLARCLALGVRVALGTDSRASNPDLDLLAEARAAARLHSAVPAEEIVALATRHGAEALGRGDECGTIELGKLANLVAVPLSESGAADPHERLLAGDDAVCHVWYRGVEQFS